MALSRYARAPRLQLGQMIGSSQTIAKIRAAIATGELSTRQIVVRGAERLDTIAGSEYGDGSLWWVLAATSDVGWGLQVPPGTIVNVPDLADVSRYLG